LPDNPSIWKISSGHGGKHWDEFLTNGLIGIGFQDAWQGDLRQVKSRDELRTALHGKTAQPKYIADQLWDFYEMQEGDIVIGYGNKWIRGLGTINSTYQFSEDSSFPYPHRLKVDWQQNPNLPAKILSPDLYKKLIQRQTLVRLKPEEYAEIEDKIGTADTRAQNLFVITAGNPEAHRNFQLSIENPVSQASCETHFSKELLDEVRSKSRDGQFYASGAMPGDRNTPNWEAIQPNDFIVVCQSSRYTHVTQVISKGRNANFARNLWGEETDQKTWELMYFLQASAKVDVALGVLTDMLNSRYFGFTRISSAKIQKILSRYGSIEEFVKQRLTSPQAEIYLLLRSNEESDWDDEQGHSYHYGSTVPNYTKIVPGAKLILDRRNPDGIKRIMAATQVSKVVEEPEEGANTKGFRAYFDNYRSLIPPRVVTEQVDSKLRELPGFNNQHSIRVLSPEAFEDLARPAPAWIFQGNPQIYDLRSKVQKLKQITSSVRTHKDKVGPGDRVYLWESGTEGGIVGVAEVVEDIRVRSSLPEETPFVRDPSNLTEDEEDKALLRIVKAAIPLLSRSQIKTHSGLHNLSILKQAQGTNFPVTPEEAEILEELLSPDEVYEQALRALSSLLDPSASQHRDEVIERFQPIFASDHHLTKEEFQSFLRFDNNKHWSSLHRLGEKACSDMDRLRLAVAVLVDKSRPTADRFDQALAEVKGLGKAVATAILLIAHPDAQGVWNNKSEKSLKQLRIWPTFDRGATKGQKYERVNSLLNRLAKDLGIDLWTLDSLLGKVPEEQPLDSILAWIQNLQTNLSPDGRFYYKPLVLLSLLHFLDDEPEHPNSFTYDELWPRFRRIAQDRGSTVSEDQFSQPYGRLRNDTNPVQVWIPEANSAIDDNRSDQPSYVRSLIPSVMVDESVWPVFTSKEGRKAMRQEILKKWSPPEVKQGLYSIQAFAEESEFDPKTIESWHRRLSRKKHVVFQGPPGTGKTYAAERLARLLVSDTSGFWEVVQLHPAYAYEDFMQGIRPVLDEQGHLTYDLQPGRFLNFCEKAKKTDGAPCVLIIDEINRAHLSRVFGELMYLLEYRESRIPLAAGGEYLQIPHNVYLIGTMNTADRSIALVDHALRRRFSFIRLQPNYEVLQRQLHKRNYPSEGLIKALKEINGAIDDPNYEVGISFFLNPNEKLEDVLPDIWEGEIESYLEEYFYDQPEKVNSFRWSSLCKDKLKEWVK